MICPHWLPFPLPGPGVRGFACSQFYIMWLVFLLRPSLSAPNVAVPPSPCPGVPAFDCPTVTHDIAVTHPRYTDPTDCQYFYVCIDGVSARRNGCTFGQVFNEAVGACTAPAEVPEW